MVRDKVVRGYNDCSYKECYEKGIMRRSAHKSMVFVKGLYFVNIW